MGMADLVSSNLTAWWFESTHLHLQQGRLIGRTCDFESHYLGPNPSLAASHSWWNGRHASLRNWCPQAWRFKSSRVYLSEGSANGRPRLSESRYVGSNPTPSASTGPRAGYGRWSFGSLLRVQSMAAVRWGRFWSMPTSPSRLHSSRRAETRLQNVSCEDQHLDGVPVGVAQ